MHRTRRTVATVAVVVAAPLLVAAECGTTSAPTTEPPPLPNTTTSQPAAAPADVPDNAQKAVVYRIVDGDTLELAALKPGRPLPSTQQVDVRLLEIDTPETKHPSEPVQCYGPKATSQLKQIAPPGSTVWVQRDQDLRDQYGRYLLYMWTDDGTFVNLALVKSGHARAVLYEPNDLHWNTISNAEAKAKNANTGLWGACGSFGEPLDTPDPTPPQDVPDPDTDEGNTYLFPPPPPDKDCGDISASNFRVRPGDPHRFDGDGDGIGCEGD